MKIIRNTDKARQRKEEVLKEILNLAQETADKGLNKFTYHFKEGERASFPPPAINICVKNESEGTVGCGYRSDYGTYVIYYIKN